MIWSVTAEFTVNRVTGLSWTLKQLKPLSKSHKHWKHHTPVSTWSHIANTPVGNLKTNRHHPGFFCHMQSEFCFVFLVNNAQHWFVTLDSGHWSCHFGRSFQPRQFFFVHLAFNAQDCNLPLWGSQSLLKPRFWEGTWVTTISCYFQV